MMKAAVKFTAIIKGKEKTFLPGDPISSEEAKELNLKAKSGLVEKPGK